jgi:hypothetical protein
MKLVVLAAFGLVLSLLAVSSTAEDFDFFYFVQQVMSTETRCTLILQSLGSNYRTVLLRA